MTYELFFDPAALDFLNSLPKDTGQRIFKKLQTAKQDPAHYFERLEGRTDYKLRVGDYRVIADLDHHSRKIFVTMIGHRKNVYQI